MKYASEQTITYLISKIKTALDGKVATTDSRLTDARTPRSHTHTKSQITDFPTIPTVPTKVSAFTNDSGYTTGNDVDGKISTALSGITGISFEVVSTLPSSGTAGKIYLKSNGGSGTNIYDEYIYYNSKWEKIGTTDVDLSGYVQSTDLTAITNTEIDTEWAK